MHSEADSARSSWPWPGIATLLVVILQLLSMPCGSAEYDGEDVDGVLYDASAYSYSTAKWYDVQVEFDGDGATIYFANGRHLGVTLDNEAIEDPHEISAYDYSRRVYWDLDVEGLD